ncbi:MAG: hypothetical protein IPK14_09495 [Blastocatellia bacterium]|nr:hypothetical protein [Blastocatellia bacterium]MBL8192706.1 hypothetical protein [Blastocatellia bacterium]MBN8724542.1 hypothetical protein [Acidobacteriota bacterium]
MKQPKEPLDKKLVKWFGYVPICIISGAILALLIKLIIYIVSYTDTSVDIITQLDLNYEFFKAHIKLAANSTILSGVIVGLAISLITPKIKPAFLRVLINIAIGAILALVSELVYKAIMQASFSNALDYLKFFYQQIVITGILVGLLISSLSLPETKN